MVVVPVAIISESQVSGLAALSCKELILVLHRDKVLRLFPLVVSAFAAARKLFYCPNVWLQFTKSKFCSSCVSSSWSFLHWAVVFQICKAHLVFNLHIPFLQVEV